MTAAPAQVPLSGPSSFDAGRVVLATLVALSVAAGFWLAYRFSGVLLALFAAIVLGTAVRPGLDGLHRRGVSRRMSGVLIYAALLVLGVSAVTLVAPVVLRRGAALTAQAPLALDRARRELLASPSLAVRGFALELPALAPAAAPGLRPVQETIAEVRLAGQTVFFVVAILLLGFSWTFEGEVTVRALLLFAPLARRADLRELVLAAEEKVGAYVRGQLIVSAVTTVLSLIAFTLIGLPDALVLALVAGAMGAVPFVGGALAGGMALLAASAEPRLIPWVIGAAGSIHALQEYVVSPRVMGKAVGVHPFTILLAISGLGSLLGVAGAVLAIPMAAVLQLLLDRFVFDRANEYQPVTAQRDRSSVLSLEAKRLALDARRHSRDEAEGGVGGASDQAVNRVESIADDLDRILTARAAAGAGPT